MATGPLQHFVCSYPATASAVPHARHAVAELAGQLPLTDEQLDAVRLAVTEAATNAVRHAYPDAPGQLHISADLAADELWILVADDGQGFQAVSQAPGLGMGLALIASVCDYFAVAERASGGTELRMGFGVPAVYEDRGSSRSATSPASPRFSTTK